MEENKNKKIKIGNYTATIIVVLLLYQLITNLDTALTGLKGVLSVISPFLYGILVAYLLYVPCKKIEEIYLKFIDKKSVARILSILTVYAIVFVILYFAFKWFIPFVLKSIYELIKLIPKYFNEAEQLIKTLPEEHILSKLNIDQTFQRIKTVDLETALAKVREFMDAESLFLHVQKVFNIASSFVNLFIAIVASIHILRSRERIYNWFHKSIDAVFPRKMAARVKRYSKKTNLIFFNYLAGQVLDAFIMGIMAIVGLLILGVEHAVILGIVIGIGNLIPYFGAFFSIALTGLITVFTGGLLQALIALIVLTVLQQIDAQIINPKILSDNLNMNPLLVMAGVTIGGAYGGPLGLFLGVPALALVKTIIDEIINEKLEHNRKEQILNPVPVLKINKNKLLKSNKNYTYNVSYNWKLRKDYEEKLDRIKEQEKINKQRELIDLREKEIAILTDNILNKKIQSAKKEQNKKMKKSSKQKKMD